MGSAWKWDCFFYYMLVTPDFLMGCKFTLININILTSPDFVGVVASF